MSEKLTVRPIEGGEFNSDYKAEQNTDVPLENVGVMAHEPWTIADKKNETPSKSKKSGSYRDRLMNQVGNHRTDGELIDESERLARILGGKSEAYREFFDPTEPSKREVVSVQNVESSESQASEEDSLQAGVRHEEEIARNKMADLMSKIISSDEARQVFADGGESALADYLESAMKDSRKLKMLINRGGHDVNLDNPFDGENTPDESDNLPVPWNGNLSGGPGELPGPNGEIPELPRPGIEVNPEYVEALAEAREDYAQKTAKSRKSYLGRFAQGNSWVGRKLKSIPGVESTLEKINSKFDTKVVEAKENYEKAYNDIAARVAQELRARGYDEETVKALGCLGKIEQDAFLEAEIVAERSSQSKDTDKFVNWWVKQQGWKGNLKKVGVVGAAGTVAGVAWGVAVPILAPWVAGAAAGGAIAAHVTRRRANAVGEDSLTLAERQSNADHAIKAAAANERHQADEYASVEDIINRTENRTTEELMGNRRRMKAAVAVAKLTGGVSALITRNVFEQPPAKTTAEVTPPKEPTPPAPTPEAPPVASATEVDVSGFKLPWNWAENSYGTGNGANAMYELGDKAEAAGHSVKWINKGLNNAQIVVDGHSDTQTVVNILNQYR